MGDDARLAIRSRSLAIWAGSGWTPWCCAEKLTLAAEAEPKTVPLCAAEVLRRIDRGRAFSNLEMQLRRCHIAGLARMRDHLSALDAVPTLDHDFARVSIGRNEAVRVADQHEVAIALQFIAGVSDDAIIRRFDWRAFRDRQIDAVVLRAVGLAAKTGNDTTANRPTERRHGSARLRSLDHGVDLSGLFFFRNVCSLYRGRARHLLQWHRPRLRNRRRRRRMRRCDRMAAARNGDLIADAELARSLQIVRTGQRREANASAARDAHERFAGLYDVDASAAGRRSGRRPVRDMAWNNQALPRPDLPCIANAVGLQDC